jgi:hypothetical protein
VNPAQEGSQSSQDISTLREREKEKEREREKRRERERKEREREQCDLLMWS